MKAELLLAWEHLRFHRLRSALLLISIALAFAAYGVLGTLRFSLNSGDDGVSQTRLIVTHQAGLMEPLPLAHLARIRALPGVADVGHATWMGAYFQDQRQMLMLFAVDPAVWIHQHPDMSIGAGAQQAFLSQRNSILVSEALASKFGWRVGDIVPLGSILFSPRNGEAAWPFRVAGVFTSSDDGGGRNYIISHYEYLNEGREFWQNTVGTFMVTASPGHQIQTLAGLIDAEFASSDAPTSSNTDQAFHAEFFAQFGNVALMIKAIIAAAFASLVLVVSSTMALAVRQSTRDIGVLKVLGYSHLRVLRLILLQTAGLILLGATAGLGIAAAVNAAVTRSLPQFMPDVVMPMPVLGEAVLIIVGMGLLIAALPAALALRIRPIQAFAIEQG
ncbi:FtsX-like permease family protein [Paucibacter sp. APW11]|uniref:FtsX-like permease family protein n=1 Tax=Roseateles aquae TaxID=3077235 RepID=A0AA48HC74_9BURK|nr:ABC transporter permease [Paucibacter sp. APW11]MDT8999857.1 FtsX-like permease family protein [Paucibacter sp. APW11]